jgi:hypothetical protein
MDVERQVTVLSSLQCYTGHTEDTSHIEKEGGVDHAKKRKKTKIIWRVYAQGKGWAEAWLILLTIARQECDSCRLGSRGHVTSSNTTIEYTYQCGYRGKPWFCDWRVKVCFERKTISGVPHASQPVKEDHREAEHRNDVFVIKIPAEGTLVHSDHTASSLRGPHPIFVAAARESPEMRGWSRADIKDFIARRNIADPMETLAHRIKKSNENARRGEAQGSLPVGTQTGTLGALGTQTGTLGGRAHSPSHTQEALKKRKQAGSTKQHKEGGKAHKEGKSTQKSSEKQNFFDDSADEDGSDDMDKLAGSNSSKRSRTGEGESDRISESAGTVHAPKSWQQRLHKYVIVLDLPRCTVEDKLQLLRVLLLEEQDTELKDVMESGLEGENPNLAELRQALLSTQEDDGAVGGSVKKGNQ